MNTDKQLHVTEIQRFCMHDGPGIRTTVFLKGCPLSCAWCHNPETQSAQSELLYDEKLCIGCGKCGDCSQKVHSFLPEHYVKRDHCLQCGLCAALCPTQALFMSGISYTLPELRDLVLRDLPFYGRDGGVTLSGGEPLAQEGTVEFLRLCKSAEISTAVETCGYVNLKILERTVPFVDFFLWDVKDTNSGRHKQYTGVSNKLILDRLQYADRLGAKTRLRCILINGVNTDTRHYSNIGALVQRLVNCQGVDILPYHAYGGRKSTLLGRRDNGKIEWIPTQDQIDCFADTLQNMNVAVRCL